MVSDDIPETLTSASDETISNEEVVAIEPTPAAGGGGVKSIGQTVIARVLIQGLNAGTGVLTARLLMPAGRGGPAFLVTPNFKGIKSYNNSTAYALGVALLSDRIAGWGPLKGQWPMASR